MNEERPNNGLRELHADDIMRHLSSPPAFGYFVDLSHGVVREELDLSGCDLCGCDFSGTVFERQVCFEHAVFRGLSWFRGATFRSAADFENACFFNDARFDDARFLGPAHFDRVDFRGIATFDNCRADIGIGFSGILANGNFSIADARLEQPATFGGATMMGGFWQRGTRLDQLDGLDQCTIYGRR